MALKKKVSIHSEYYILILIFRLFRVTAMALFGDSGQHNTYAGVALARHSGTIGLQYFPKHLALAAPTEVEKLEKMMAEASCDS